MKLKLIITFFCLLSLATVAAAQSVVITKKKVTYTRPKPISEYKKQFYVNYPQIKAATPAISKKIGAIISYEKVFEMNIKDELGGSQWLEAADFTVLYNKNGVLSIAVIIEGSGAYPDGSTKVFTIDSRTGVKLKPIDVFTNLDGLLAMVKKKRDKEVAMTIAEVKKDPENADADIEALLKESEEQHKVTLDEFSIEDKGVLIYHDYSFPHVAKALEPFGEFRFSWAEIKPYIKAGGLLSPLAR